MAFRPVKFNSGRVQRLPVKASEVLTKHNLVKFSAGYIVAAASGDDEVEYLSLETVTGGATDGIVLVDVLPISDDVEIEALSQDTPVQATHVGNDYDLQSAAQIDLDATTDKVFHIDRIVSAADKLVYGRFNRPAIA